MKRLSRYKVSLLYAILITIVLAIGLYFVTSYFPDLRDFFSKSSFSNYIIFGGVLFCFAFIFLGVYMALRTQTQKDISQLYELLPDLKNENEKVSNVTSLSEEINNLTKDKRQEIDVLLERENYRREFLGNVAHELKTPLFSIQGYLLTLIEGGVDDENIRDKYLNRINKSVERLTYIVKDLDLISELESGNISVDSYPFNIVAITQEIFDLLEIKAENNKVKLRFDRAYDSPIKVMGDIEKIEQVLTNLIANAINHSQRPSTITVSFTQEDDKVKIQISDTGMGMKTEELNRIFERFYRVDKSRSRDQGGSGLGLSIVKHILEAHGEKIYVESTYGKGATFYFYLQKAQV